MMPKISCLSLLFLTRPTVSAVAEQLSPRFKVQFGGNFVIEQILTKKNLVLFSEYWLTHKNRKKCYKQIFFACIFR